MTLDKYDDLRLILANMMRDDKQCNTLGKGSDNMEKYLQQIVKFFDISVVSVSLFSNEITIAAEEHASRHYPNPTIETYLDKNAIRQAFIFGAIKQNELQVKENNEL